MRRSFFKLRWWLVEHLVRDDVPVMANLNITGTAGIVSIETFDAELLAINVFPSPVRSEPPPIAFSVLAVPPVPMAEDSPEDLRALGWSVAIHNDYSINGKQYTFWLFSKPLPGTEQMLCVKGEGETDSEALNQIRRLIKGSE